MDLRLLSVNVGRPRIIGDWNGEPVLSAIVKAPVLDATVRVSATNIEGDAQADLRVHGGVDKAVYCYPADHWPWWEREKDFRCGPASFGENLTVEGADETAVAIGDRFRWGDVLLEVSEPRAPCYKFAMLSGRSDAPAMMTVSGRCGWYCRVLKEGQADVRDARLERVEPSGGPSVREAFFAALDPRTPAATRARVAAARGLAASWIRALSRQ